MNMQQEQSIAFKTGMLSICLFILLGLLYLPPESVAQQESSVPPGTAIPDSIQLKPPIHIEVKDTPDDAGGSVTIRWEEQPVLENAVIQKYRILRASVENSVPGEFIFVGEATNRATVFSDGSTDDDSTYVYKVEAVYELKVDDTTVVTTTVQSSVSDEVSSSAQWFNFQRINVFVGVVLLSFFILYYIYQAQSGKKLFIRKIAGLEAVDEAVGRATEMGKKIFYIPGTQDMDNVQTIAGVTILGRVAEIAAQYDTWLEVPVSRSLVLVTAKEIVKEAYSKVGRPDAFREDQVHYLTDDQFGYAAGIDGMVVRERPATIFYMGAFYAESLILAETGNSIGAIQISGTAMPSQLPFFVAACDYTLIGEELFAASAYLSREPKLLGSLKGQDVGKALILISLLVGTILETFHIWQFSSLFKVIGE